MKKDLETTEDIRLLVDSFYARVREDDVIGFVFNDVAKVNWALHLPKMYAFWEAILFGNAGFKGNPMAVHIQLDQIEPLTEAHFDRWKQLWDYTVQTNFFGPTAEKAKKQADSIRQLMMLKINNYRTGIGIIPNKSQSI